MTVEFPKFAHQEYYHTHFKFVLDIFRSRVPVVLKSGLDIDCTNFYCIINGIKACFNVSDDPILGIENIPKDIVVFKFHKNHSYPFGSNVFSFSPISFYNWTEYRRLSPRLIYQCRGDVIMNSQIISGNAVERRTKVRQLLKNRYGSVVDDKISNQSVYWRRLSQCMVSVCVPGYCNNMMDRGHLQSIAFGICTISPELPEVYPNGIRMIPGQHYIKCADDYSDLLDKVEWCRSNRNVCREIGQNAKRCFTSCLTNDHLIAWVQKCLMEFQRTGVQP